ncbi:flavin reductase [Streptomyces sp. NPDC005820]|uniref:flavin reductase family protein n=1 Tax=Streptomyces sp. NPDC005820 TaxID=3157069 RepID=UPI0033FFB5A2
MSDHKAKQGYRYEPDKFSAAQLTEQESELIRAPRVAECPIQLECKVVSSHPFGSPASYATAFQAEVLRAHVEDELVIPGTHYELVTRS